MVALLVSLRWRQLSRQLTKSPWVLVALVFSALAALGMLVSLTFALGALRSFLPEAAPVTLVAVGAVITIGWWLGSLLVGVDDSLAPERFSLLPVTATRLLPGLVVAGMSGIGGIGTAIALLLMLVGWSVSIPALIAALVLAPVALATCVLGARVIAGALAKWLSNRRTRDVIVIVGVLLISCSGLLINVVTLTLLNLTPATLEQLASFGEALGYMPFAAVFGVSAAIAQGSWLVAAIRLLIALVTLALLYLAARSLLAKRLVAPITDSGGGTVRTGKLLDRMLPASPTGAIAARSLRYRRRDPRHVLNTVMLIVFPLIFIALQVMQSLQGIDMGLGPALVLLPAVNALMIGIILQMDNAYDFDAQALHIIIGVRGRDDRAGRLLAMGIVSVPIFVVLCVLACVFVGRIDLIPASLGATLGTTAVAAGAGAWVGTWLPGRAPAPEANPLGKGSSGGIQSMLAIAVWGPITAVLGGIPLGLAIWALWSPMIGWASLGAALIVGAGVIAFGIIVGGKVLDRRWPEVLAAVTSE